jgi:5-methyltetrahydrofolate--homocysteine methyltransferase
MNPVRPAEMNAVRAANLLMNHDPNGTAWISANREQPAEGEAPRGRGGRESRRRRSAG